MKNLLLCFLLLPLFSLSQMNARYKNLVFEGGGIRGLAYAGALKVLEEKEVIKNIENVAGSSAGAIAALMVSLGYNSHEIDSILYSLKIQQFNDGKGIGSIYRLRKEYGIFKGEKIESWLSQLIKNKTGRVTTTFKELHQLHVSNNTFKDLYCTGTNISRQQLEIFSWQHTPGMQLATAVHISSCIPVYFKPIALDSLWQEVSLEKNKNHYELYVDGGMLCNYPINMFDTCINGLHPLLCNEVKYNFQTLGLKLERPEQIKQFDSLETDLAPYSVSSMKDYIMAVMNLLIETLNRKTPGLQNEKGRTIYISYGDIFGKIRKVSESEKKELFDNGVKGAERFFINQDNHFQNSMNIN